MNGLTPWKRISAIFFLFCLLAIGSLHVQLVLAQEKKTPLNDPLFAKQKKLFERLNVLEAWKFTKGSPHVRIGVIDSGFDFFHPDLHSQLSPGFYAPEGYHTEVYENIAHGTLVSSLIAAKENNGIGMSGLAPGCRILTASLGMIEHKLLKLQKKFMKDHPKGSFADLQKEMMKHREQLKEFGAKWTSYQASSTAKAIRYLTDREVKVIKISSLLKKGLIASVEARNQLENAFQYAAGNDVLLVIGAGNNAQLCEDYPGDASSTIVAGATLLNDERWEEERVIRGFKLKQGSNFGKRLSFMAPVENLVVCVPHDKRTYVSQDSPMGATKVEYRDMYETIPNGATSSAAPIVTSLAALIRSVRPDLNAKAVIEIIKRGCDDVGKKGYDVYTGHGRVNFGKSIKLAKEWGKTK